MARPSPPVERLQWILFRIALTVLLALPRFAYTGFASFVGNVAFHVARRYRRTARLNLRNCFPGRWPPVPGDNGDAADKDLDRFIRLSYRHMFCSYLEGFQARRLMRRTGWQRHFHVQMSDAAREALLRARQQPPGVLMCTGHLGPWELTIHPTAMAGLPMDVVARPIDNRLVDRDVVRMRDQYGNRTVSKFRNLTALMRDLRGGQSIGFVIDQDAGIHARGTFVQFFGRWCKSVDAPAMLAIRYGAALMPSFGLRLGLSWDYLLVFGDPIDTTGLDARNEAHIQDVMQRWHDALEDVVRRYPDQYEWFHHKWRTRPPGEAGADPARIDQQPGAGEKARRLGYWGGDTRA